ncbi:hypothetical protein [Archaeoglobus profundus]|uniref:Uncharacterized protein n=1 Tax=Archaeoglobus profundus (strain DSM 5631 / JCM 9629 / NBRC 100127 / Av18) TaxID=572546 RepID=D2RDJ3_ARCPA|nr:hypothetical protein [Archaeoglobus profundus]ADB58187.1 hypothetical protein Arcpr_1129 [Archaeoglobus profundus DSM 5631]
MVNGNIKAGIYKDYAYVYYLRITDNSGYCSALLSSALKLICKKFGAKYIGCKSKGHGVKSFNKPHIHALLLTNQPIALDELKKIVPSGFNFKLWRIRTTSDFQSAKKYIKEHVANPKKRGFLLKAEILAGRISRKLLEIMKLMLRLRKLKLSLINSQAHQRGVKRLKEVRLWKE